MTWKTYAAMSGATVLAGWMASSPPANAPTNTAARSTPSRRAAPPASSDIADQAERLQTRLRAERLYAVPQRDPFRFTERAPVAESRDERRGSERLEPSAEITPVPVPSPAPFSLSGIAEDQVNGQPARTAVLSSPGGVLLVREGEDILGYRVARIESEAVELVKTADGSTTRLTLK